MSGATAGGDGGSRMLLPFSFVQKSGLLLLSVLRLCFIGYSAEEDKNPPQSS